MIKITISGPQGCGKSMLAGIIANAISVSEFSYGNCVVMDGFVRLHSNGNSHTHLDILIKTKQQKPTKATT